MESLSVGVFWVTELLSLCYLHTTFTLWQIHYNHTHGVACAICDVHPTSSSRSFPFGFSSEAAACSSLSPAPEHAWAGIFLSLPADVQRLGHKGSVCSRCGSWQVSGSLLGPQEARTLLPWRGVGCCAAVHVLLNSVRANSNTLTMSHFIHLEA